MEVVASAAMAAHSDALVAAAILDQDAREPEEADGPGAPECDPNLDPLVRLGLEDGVEGKSQEVTRLGALPTLEVLAVPGQEPPDSEVELDEWAYPDCRERSGEPDARENQHLEGRCNTRFQF